MCGCRLQELSEPEVKKGGGGEEAEEALSIACVPILKVLTSRVLRPGLKHHGWEALEEQKQVLGMYRGWEFVARLELWDLVWGRGVGSLTGQGVFNGHRGGCRQCRLELWRVWLTCTSLWPKLEMLESA